MSDPRADPVLCKSQDFLSRLVSQERSNAALLSELRVEESAARDAARVEQSARDAVDAAVCAFLSICFHRNANGADVAALLEESAACTEASLRAFAAEVQLARVELLVRKGETEGTEFSDASGTERMAQLQRAAEAEERQERDELTRLEEEIAELERRTELSTLRCAADLFQVRLD